jgi:hypothetical protein
MYKKDKFLVNNDYNTKSYNIKRNIDHENKLQSPCLEDKEKTQVILSNTLNPNDFSLNYSNGKKNIMDSMGFYYNNINKGPGRGFGNLNIATDIRNGDSSRSNTKNFKKQQESLQLLDFQFSYLDKNFQDPQHIVMPIPRGGESTRTKHQLNINSYTMNNNFEFQY